MTQITQYLTNKIIEFTPRIISLIVFLVIAYIFLKIFNKLIDKYLDEKIEEKSIIQLGKLVSKIFIYYAIILAIIAILGLDQLAASLGTAIGFLALGVSFAMKDILTDIVSGVYLIKDPDIQIGDKNRDKRRKRRSQRNRIEKNKTHHIRW